MILLRSSSRKPPKPGALRPLAGAGRVECVSSHPSDPALAVSPRIGYVVGRLDRAIRREIGALVAPFGLTVPKYTALSILRDRPGLSNAQLARRCYVRPQSMSEVLAALEADGLIVRSPAANHGRVVEVALSDRGNKVLA